MNPSLLQPKHCLPAFPQGSLCDKIIKWSTTSTPFFGSPQTLYSCPFGGQRGVTIQQKTPTSRQHHFCLAFDFIFVLVFLFVFVFVTCVVSLQLGGLGGVVLPSPSLKSHSTEPWVSCLGFLGSTRMISRWKRMFAMRQRNGCYCRYH